VIQELLAGWLGAGLGSYCHRVDSLHLYEGDLPAAQRLPEPAGPGPAMTQLAVRWDALDEVLGQVISGRPVTGAGWAEIGVVLASYRSWKTGDRRAARQAVAQCPGPLAEALYRWYDRLEQGRRGEGPASNGGSR